MGTGSVVPLAAVGAGDVEVAGGKGANLGELVRAGFAVPEGFVITTAAYLDALAGAGLGAQEAPPAAGSLDVPPPVAAAVRDAYAALGAGPVAVRSSATAEDLAGAASAGQQETSLQVVGPEAVLDAVRSCWASLWGERAVAYRREVGSDAAPAIAVVVQRMVPAELAGVLFTANPVTGARDEVVVDASPGLGEAVVSGLVTPEHVVVDTRGRVREHRDGRAEVVVRPRAGGGVEREEQAAGARAGDLFDDLLRELVATGRRTAVLFGRPQDVEWAYADGRLWVLQARPLTALPPAPVRVGPVRRASAGICAELLPTRPYPLDLTAWTAPGWFGILERMAAEIGGIRIDLDQVLRAEDGVLTELRPPDPRPTWRSVTAPFRMLARVRRFDPARWTADPRYAAYDHAVRAMVRRDVRALPWPDLLRVPGEVLATLGGFVGLRIDHLPRVVVDVVRLAVLLAMAGRPSLLWPLLGGAPTQTRAANDALAAIADRVRTTPAWAAAFAQSTDDELVTGVWHDLSFAPLRDALTGWLEAYGHRETTSAALVSASTWAEEPALLLASVRLLVSHPGRTPDEDVAATALEQAGRSPLVRLAGSGARVARAASRARAAVGFREDSHSQALRLRPVLRAALLEAGDRLAVAGVLADRDEVFSLRLDELTALDEPAGLGQADRARVRAVVERRAARRAALGRAPLISPATLHPRAGRPVRDALVSGAPGGGGRASGTVRVVRGPAEFGRLRRGEVLVCPYTNPAWTPLFALASAVVADAGSAGSHAAIVAREYGIPAVMGTGDGTRVLGDGRRVRVDGDRGVVVEEREAGRA